jgi:GAF domain-containing protein
MKAPLIPLNETDRLKALAELFIMDTSQEEDFDLITRFASIYFKVPIALITFVDKDRQWFKSKCGLETSETQREVSFCGHAILEDVPMIVEDSLNDDRFADNPLVVGPPHVRFYAGAPIKLSSGFNVGTLCVIDHQPRHFEPYEIEMLEDLARVVAKNLEKSSKKSKTSSSNS